VVKVEEPPNSTVGQMNHHTINVQKQFVSAVTSASISAGWDLNTSTDSSTSPSFGPRVESFSEGSPASLSVGSNDPLGNRRLRRARDSMIIARDPNAHRNYVLEKSAERIADNDIDDENEQSQHQASHASFASGLPPPSAVNTRRGSLETLGSSTSTIELPSPSRLDGSRHDDDADRDMRQYHSLQQQQQQQQHETPTSPMLGSTSSTSNNLGFTHDSIALAHDPHGHKLYVRQHAETFSALSRMEWDAVEHQRRRLLEDDDHRAKLDQLGVQHQLQQQYQQFFGAAPFSGDGSEATSALARLRQLQAPVTYPSTSMAVVAASPNASTSVTVPLIERDSALKWIQQEARARILQQQTDVERTWAVDALARDVQPPPPLNHYRSAAASALATGTASAASSSLGNDPNLLLEQRLAEVMGRLLTQDSVYLYQQALDAMLIDNAAWALDAMNLYREFLATMPPKTREVEVQAPEGGGLAQRDSGTDPRQPPSFTPSFPLGVGSQVNAGSSSRGATTTTTSSQQENVRPLTGQRQTTNSADPSTEDEENELLSRLQRIRTLRGDTASSSSSSVVAASTPYPSYHPVQQYVPSRPAPDDGPQSRTHHGFGDSSVVELPRRQRYPRLIHTPDLPNELRRGDAGAAISRITGHGYAAAGEGAPDAGAASLFMSPVHPQPYDHHALTSPALSPAAGQQYTATPAGFYRAHHQQQGGYSPASSVISTPPPPRDSTSGAMFPVFSKPSPLYAGASAAPPATSTPSKSAAAVLRWDVKRSGNVLISQSGTLTMSDSSRALKALHEEGALATQDKSTVSIPMFALGTVGISQGDLVFEARFELRASKETLPAAGGSQQHSSSRLLSASAYRAGQRASLHKTYIGVASKYYKGASRSTPAYLYCSDGTISATSALSNPQSTAEAVPYGRPFHCSAVVTIHLSFSRRELSFAVDGVPQGVAFKFQRQDDPEPLFPLVVFTGDGDSCAFQAPSLPPQVSSAAVFGPPSASRTHSRSPTRNPASAAAHYLESRGSNKYRPEVSPIAPQNVSRPLY
jgi:hypothetical protein